MSMLVDDGSRYIVTDYFLDEDDLGKIHFNGDHFVHSFTVTPAGLLIPDSRFHIDFNTVNTVVAGVQLRPHGAEVSSMMAH